MVLNRFLVVSEVELLGRARVEEGGRVGIVVVEVVGFALFVEVLSTSFIGLDETGLFVNGFFSALATELRVDLRSLVDGVVLPSIDRLVLAGFSETRLLGAAGSGFLFSDSDPVPLLSWSTDFTDTRGLCSVVVDGAVVGVIVDAGRADLAVTGGRVGGLLSPLPGVAREDTCFVLLEADGAEDAAAAAGRLDVDKGRFGGAVVFFEGFVREPSGSVLLPFAFSLGERAISSSRDVSGIVSAEGVSIEGFSVAEAIVCRLQLRMEGCGGKWKAI